MYLENVRYKTSINKYQVTENAFYDSKRIFKV